MEYHGFDSHTPLHKKAVVMFKLGKHIPLIAMMVVMTVSSSCSRLVFENRNDCPAFLFFNISNAGIFDVADYVHVAAFKYPEESLLSKDTTTVRQIQEKEFYLQVKRSDSVFGYGMAGFKKCHLVNETDWVVDEGSDFDPLWRFDYRTPAVGERFYIPVEMVKDHSVITVYFEDYDRFPGSDGRFPYDIVVRGNTVGIDGLTGEPVAGVFRHSPKENPGGTFRFTVPRQYDRSMTLEVWEKAQPSASEDITEGEEDTPVPAAQPKRIASFRIWDWIFANEDFSWAQKNLPDVEMTIHMKSGEYTFKVMPWEGNEGGYIYEL